MKEDDRRRAPRTGLIKAGDVLPEILPPALFEDVIDPKDIGYTHPVFVQCFLPTRHTAKNKQRWQTDCGRASLVIRAGELANPAKPNDFKQCIVPAGPKARFVVGYVNDQLQRHNSPTVNMGESLRVAMRKMNIPIGGKNGHELQREVENFAAAEIGLGLWDANGNTHHSRALIAPHLSFWLEKDTQQRTLWQPEMTVSREYFDAIRDGDRLAPFYWPAMIALQHDTRAMDIHAFLVYRLRNGLKRPVPLNIQVLHSLFGRDIQSPKKFWESFRKSLEAALKWYPQAFIEVKNDCIVLHNSPALIPHKKVGRISGL